MGYLAALGLWFVILGILGRALGRRDAAVAGAITIVAGTALLVIWLAAGPAGLD